MHEASIANYLIQAVEQRIDASEIVGKVHSICLRVGRMTAVVPDNLRFLFGVLAEGSAVEGARLDIEETMIRGRCRTCGTDFDIEDLYFLCRNCGSSDLDIVSGRELMIIGVEVE